MTSPRNRTTEEGSHDLELKEETGETQLAEAIKTLRTECQAEEEGATQTINPTEEEAKDTNSHKGTQD